ncbi:MAG: serine/threonine protein kinase, partial [Candidatus Xenobia bacterium]
MLASGQALKGGYIIEDVVGYGGSSVVYRARAARAGRVVAIKEMKVPSDDARLWIDTLNQLHKEVAMLASLRHGGLAEVVECLSDDQHIFLVMELIEGRTLDDVVESLPGLVSLATVLPWIEQTAEVLAYLHHRNPPIVFRDLKPSNIMLQSGGRIRLIDFGIARMLHPASETDGFIKFAGTPGYMPPEQGSVTEHTDPRSDLYALGATIYTLLLKKVPPSAASRRTGAASLLPASTWHPEVTEEVDQVLARMMALHREDRYATVQEAWEAFSAAAQRALSKHPVLSSPGPRAPDPEQPAVHFCGKCHAVLEVAAHFCMMCGEKLDDVEPLRSLLPGPRPRPENPGAHTIPSHIGPYRIQRLLASGGMANIYVAEFPSSPQAYALKLLAEISDTDALARFE